MIHTALAKARQGSVAESSLRAGDVVIRRGDTARTRVQVVEPLVGDMRVTQVLSPHHLLPGSFSNVACPSATSAGFCLTTARAPLGALVH